MPQYPTNFGFGILRVDDETNNLDDTRQAYQRRYWRQYRRGKRRIYGTMRQDDFSALKARADEAGRSPWAQIYAEAAAYRAGHTLATGEIAHLQKSLITELRRIGNNINQLARLGNIMHRQGGDLHQVSALLQQAHHQLKALEEAVAQFKTDIK